jgi:hypothetical protein
MGARGVEAFILQWWRRLSPASQRSLIAFYVSPVASLGVCLFASRVVWNVIQERAVTLIRAQVSRLVANQAERMV